MKKLIPLLYAFVTVTSSAGTWKFFSMNLHCALGDWKGRVDTVVAHILKTEPDVIGLQEVCFNDDINMTTYIVDSLRAGGYPVVYRETMKTHQSFVKYQEELLMITKHRVLQVDKGDLPSMKYFENKYLALELDDFWVATTHLHFALPSVRSSQYQKLADLLSERKAILFGDFNSNPKNGETHSFKKGQWKPYFGKPTFPSDKPKNTFDGFWATSDFSSTVQEHQVNVIFENHPNPPSDHLGVELELVVAP